MDTKYVKPSRRKPILILAALLILAAGGLGWWYVGQNRPADNERITRQPDSSSPVKDKQPDKPADKIIHMSAMGDMLAHDTIIANAKTDSGYDFTKFFQNIRSYYQKSDVVFCNQEGLSSGEQYGISGYPSFNAPKQFAANLQSVGCNLINLANNHMGDKGVAATDATIDVWRGLKPLAFSGANKSAEDQNRVSYATVNGIKIGFVSFADFNNNSSTPSYSINIYHNENLVRRLITEARKEADVVIVSMHWGVEDSGVVSADQRSAADLLSSLGTDVIIGTGPHVLQKAETIKRPDGGKMTVWYSLGNMLSSQLNVRELIGGIAQFDITKSAASGKISIGKLSFVPTYMHYEWTATEAANNNLLARRNAMIYPLESAAKPLSRSLLNTTVAQQRQYVIDTLGREVTVK